VIKRRMKKFCERGCGMGGVGKSKTQNQRMRTDGVEGGGWCVWSENPQSSPNGINERSRRCWCFFDRGVDLRAIAFGTQKFKVVTDPEFEVWSVIFKICDF
jgi:hypothetical protein